MQKETKIGLAVVGALLVLFATVLGIKLTRSKAASPDSKTLARADGAKPGSTAANAKEPGSSNSVRWLATREGEPSQPAQQVEEASSAEQPAAARANPFAARQAAASGEASGEAAVTDEATEPTADAQEPQGEPSEAPAEMPATEEAGSAGADPFNRSRSAAASGSGLMPAEAPQELEPAEETETTASAASGAADEPAVEEAAPTAAEESSEVVKAAGSDAPAQGRAGAFAAKGSRTSPRRAPPATLEPAEDPPAARLAPAARQRVEPGPYTIEPNDNFWTISEKVYGSGGYFKALREHNKQKVDDPDALAVGDVIEAPPAADLARRYPSLCPKPRRTAAVRRGVTQASNSRPAGAKTYTVAEGDTLFDIARYELGKAARWAELYELNRDALGEDFDFLKPGTELVLPQGADEELTRRRGEAVER